MSDHAARLAAPFAVLGVTVRDDWVTGIDYLPPRTAPLRPRDALAREACRQLRAYLDDPRFEFSLPLLLGGTPFQRRVWEAIVAVPAGGTASYGELARRLRTSARAVGQACGANPLPVLVPCHRILAARGIGGFMNGEEEAALAIKRWLLRHEAR